MKSAQFFVCMFSLSLGRHLYCLKCEQRLKNCVALVRLVEQFIKNMIKVPEICWHKKSYILICGIWKMPPLPKQTNKNLEQTVCGNCVQKYHLGQVHT